MNKTTTITFQPEHLSVIQKALEAYSRARMGQFKNWFEETIGRSYSWDCGEDIEKFIRLRTIEEHLENQYGRVEIANRRQEYFEGLKNGSAYDTVTSVTFLKYYAAFINTFPRSNEEPFPRETNSSWGILQKGRVGDGQIAYEVYQTLRQYNAVTLNGGLFDHYTSTQDPLNWSGVNLPEIQGFEKYKDYHFNKAESRKLHKFCEKKDYPAAWKYIDAVLRPKYKIPRGDSAKIQWKENYCDVAQYSWPKDDSYYVRVNKPRKEDKPTEILPEKSLTEPTKSD